MLHLLWELREYKSEQDLLLPQNLSAHSIYKDSIVSSKDTDTMLILKKIGMARILKNEFGQRVQAAESSGATEERLKTLLGSKREMKGIFEGDFSEGMMEAGQGAGMIGSILSVKEIFDLLIDEYNNIKISL